MNASGSMRSRRSVVALAVAACIAGLTIAGCGSSETTIRSAASQTSSSSMTSSTTSVPAATTPTPLATSTSSWGDEPLKLEILSLTRTGRIAEVTMSLENTGHGSGFDSHVQLANLFSGSLGDNSTKYYDTLAGLALIDPVNNLEYPVARDANGNCMCDTQGDNTYVDPGQSITLSAVFGAPAASVSSVDLFVPHFGTFHLPISGG